MPLHKKMIATTLLGLTACGLATPAFAATKPQAEAPFFTEEQAQEHEALVQKIKAVTIPEGRSLGAAILMNMVLPGSGTLYATNSPGLALGDTTWIWGGSALLTGITWFSSKDSTLLQAYSPAVALPVIFAGYDVLLAAYRNKPLREVVEPALAQKHLDESQLADLNQLGETQRAQLKQDSEALAGKIDHLLAQKQPFEARKLFAGFNKRYVAQDAQTALQGKIDADVATLEKRLPLMFGAITQLEDQKKYRQAMDLLGKFPTATSYEQRLSDLKDELTPLIAQQAEEEKQAEEARQAKQTADAKDAAAHRYGPEVYQALRAGKTGAALHALAVLEQKAGITRADLEAGDLRDLLGGSCKLDEPLLLNGTVFQVMSDGYLMHVTGDDIIYVKRRQSFNLVDHNAVSFGAVYRGTVSYTTIFGARNTVRCVEMRTKLDAW